jgi:tetratricopeptide (TPR) repeat protein
MLQPITTFLCSLGALVLLLATPALAQVDSVRASTLPGRQVAEKAYNAGLASFNARNYTAAITSFDQALAAKPDFAAAYANRAATRLALKEYPAAVTDYDQALKLEPSAYAAYFGRGQATTVPLSRPTPPTRQPGTTVVCCASSTASIKPPTTISAEL